MTQFFKDMNEAPEDKQEVVLLTNSGDLISPVCYIANTKTFRVPKGEVRSLVIKGWAPLDQIKKALNIPELSEEEKINVMKTDIERIAKERGKSINDLFAEALLDKIFNTPSSGMDTLINDIFGDFFKSK